MSNFSDDVNAHFKAHYPPASHLGADCFEYSPMLGGMLRYLGKTPTIFPKIECADGFSFSVQGHFGAYSTPRDDFADRYSKVEVGFPSQCDDLLLPYMDGGEDTDPTATVYGYVPVELVNQIIAGHGGLRAKAEG